MTFVSSRFSLRWLLLLIVGSACWQRVAAQKLASSTPDFAAPATTTSAPPIRNLKVLDEHTEGDYLIRVVQFDQGLMRVTQTIQMPKPATAYVGLMPVRLDTLNKQFLEIQVIKSLHRLVLTYRHKPIRQYIAVFGPNPMLDKQMEGDRCTPEGCFKILTKNPGSKYDKFMLLNYPNDSSYAHFNKAKAEGRIPANAAIGGSVGIHGIWPGGDDMIEMGVGWTDGCIALRNKDIEELFSIIDVGTKVTIISRPKSMAAASATPVIKNKNY